MLDSAAARDAAPPERTHRQLNTPGSPMDCAAITPISFTPLLLMMWPRAGHDHSGAHIRKSVSQEDTTERTLTARQREFSCRSPLFVQQRVAWNQNVRGTGFQHIFRRHATRNAVRSGSFVATLDNRGRIQDAASCVPRSSSVTTRSCATSTRRRVR